MRENNHLPRGTSFIVARSAVLAALAAACSSRAPDAMRSASQIQGHHRDASADAPAGTKCGPAPHRILNSFVHGRVDVWPGLPDSRDAGLGVQVPLDVAVAGPNLFYLLIWDLSLVHGGTLMRMPITGGEPVRVADVRGGGPGGSQAFALSGSTAIFSEAQADDAGAGAIVSVPENGEPTILALTDGLANALVTDDENVYFADSGGIKSVPVTGGPVRALTPEKAFSLSVSEGTLYLEDSDTGAVSSMPVEGGALTQWGSHASYPVRCGASVCAVGFGSTDGSFVTKDGTVHFLTAGEGQSLYELNPGEPPKVLASDIYAARSLLFDGESLLLSSGGHSSGPPMSVPIGGTTAVQLPQAMANIAIDESCAYWADWDGIYAQSRTAVDSAGDGGQ